MTKGPSLFSDIPGNWRGRTLRRGCELNILIIIIAIPYVVVVVLTLTHRYLVNAVRGHKTGSNTLEFAGVEDYFRRENNTHKINMRIYVFPILFIIFVLLLSPCH